MSAFCLEQTAGTEWVRFSSLSLGIFLGDLELLLKLHHLVESAVCAT